MNRRQRSTGTHARITVRLAAACLVALGTLVPLAPATAQQWSQLQPTDGPPPPRFNHTAIYDSANNRMIVFGGESLTGTGFLNDVWVLTNANGIGETPQWINLIPDGAPASPARRRYHRAVYDAATNRMIVFGGQQLPGIFGGDPTNLAGTLNDVWILNNANGLGGPPSWSLVTPTGTPPHPRGLATVTYDPVSNRLTVAAGFPDPNCVFTPCFLLNDVWILQNANAIGGTPHWVNAIPDSAPGSPTHRSGANGSYDAQTNRMIFQLGAGVSPPGHAFTALPLQDIWVLQNANAVTGAPGWTQLAPTGQPPSVSSTFGDLYDPISNRLPVLGPGPLDRLWILQAANGLQGPPSWTQLNIAGISPAHRESGSAVYDRSSNRIILFAGFVRGTAFNTALNDVWVLTNANGVVTVAIDIKPGSDPNSINLGSGGTVPVAIFSTATFDATTVDPTTVTLASASVKLKGNGTPMASFEDVNGDGFLDLIVHVNTEALELTEGDTQAVLKGQTFSGQQIQGTDSVRVVP